MCVTYTFLEYDDDYGDGDDDDTLSEKRQVAQVCVTYTFLDDDDDHDDGDDGDTCSVRKAAGDTDVCHLYCFGDVRL